MGDASSTGAGEGATVSRLFEDVVRPAAMAVAVVPVACSSEHTGTVQPRSQAFWDRASAESFRPWSASEGAHVG
jgi:hypothetical protein